MEKKLAAKKKKVLTATIFTAFLHDLKHKEKES